MFVLNTQNTFGVEPQAENLTRLVRAFPHIRDDPYVAFPVKIFDCVAPSGKKAPRDHSDAVRISNECCRGVFRPLRKLSLYNCSTYPISHHQCAFNP